MKRSRRLRTPADTAAGAVAGALLLPATPAWASGGLVGNGHGVVTLTQAFAAVAAAVLAGIVVATALLLRRRRPGAAQARLAPSGATPPAGLRLLDERALAGARVAVTVHHDLGVYPVLLEELT